jgi:nitroreductase
LYCRAARSGNADAEYVELLNVSNAPVTLYDPAKAPVLIVIMARLDLVAHRLGGRVQDVPFYLIDVGIAGEHLALQAEEAGLGTCWVGWFNVRKTRKFFKIPRKLKIICLMAMGYYEKRPWREKKRKPLEEIVWFNRLDDR